MSVLKLPPAAIGTVFASRVLPGDAKVLWEKHVYLDRNPEGCRMSASQMAMLVGRTTDFVEVARGKLMRLGLLYKTGTTRGVSWYVTFPQGYLPAAARPTAAEYAAAAAPLDACFRELGGWNPDSPSHDRERPHSDSLLYDREYTPVSSPASVTEGGFRGVVPQSPGLVRDSLNSGSQDRGESCQDSGTAIEGTEIPAMRAALRDLDARLGTAGDGGGQPGARRQSCWPYVVKGVDLVDTQ